MHAILTLANPDSPICDDQGFFRCLRVNTLTPSPRSNDPRSFANPPDGFEPSILPFDGEIPSPPPSSRTTSAGSIPRRNTGTIFPELRPPTPSENFHELCTPFQLKHSPSVEVLLGPVHSRLKCLNPLLLRLPTETQLRPALTCTARIARHNSGRSENKGSTA